MIRNSDILFGRIAVKFRFVSRENTRQAIKEVSALQVLGIEKRLPQVMFERGYLIEEEIYAILEALLQSKQISRIRTLSTYLFTEEDERKFYAYLGLEYQPNRSEALISLPEHLQKRSDLPISCENLLACLNIKHNLNKAKISVFLLDIIYNKQFLTRNFSKIISDLDKKKHIIIKPSKHENNQFQHNVAVLFWQLGIIQGKLKQQDLKKIIFIWESLSSLEISLHISDLLFYMGILDKKSLEEISESLAKFTGIDQKPRFPLLHLSDTEQSCFEKLLNKGLFPEKNIEKAKTIFMRLQQEGLNYIRLSDVMILQKTLTRKQIIQQWANLRKKEIEQEVEKMQIDRTQEIDRDSVFGENLGAELAHNQEAVLQAEAEEKLYQEEFKRKIVVQNSPEDNLLEKEFDETFQQAQEERLKEVEENVQFFQSELQKANVIDSRNIHTVLSHIRPTKYLRPTTVLFLFLFTLTGLGISISFWYVSSNMKEREPIVPNHLSQPEISTHITVTPELPTHSENEGNTNSTEISHTNLNPNTPSPDNNAITTLNPTISPTENFNIKPENQNNPLPPTEIIKVPNTIATNTLPPTIVPPVIKENEYLPKNIVVDWEKFHHLQNKMLLAQKEAYSASQQKAKALWQNQRWTSMELLSWERSCLENISKNRIFFNGEWHSKESLGIWNSIILKKDNTHLLGFLLRKKELYEFRPISNDLNAPTENVQYFSEKDFLSKKISTYPWEYYWHLRNWPSNIQEHITLARWCQGNLLENSTKIEWEKVLTQSPNHPEAKYNLGYKISGETSDNIESFYDLVLTEYRNHNTLSQNSSNEEPEIAKNTDGKYKIQYNFTAQENTNLWFLDESSQIQNETLEIQAPSSSPSLAYYSIPFTGDFTLSMDFYFSKNPCQNLMIRFFFDPEKGEDNGYLLCLNSSQVNLPKGHWLKYYTNSDKKILAKAEAPLLALKQWHNLTIKVIEDTIEVFLQKKLLFRVIDKNFRKGILGIGGLGTFIHFDKVNILGTFESEWYESQIIEIQQNRNLKKEVSVKSIPIFSNPVFTKESYHYKIIGDADPIIGDAITKWVQESYIYYQKIMGKNSFRPCNIFVFSTQNDLYNYLQKNSEHIPPILLNQVALWLPLDQTILLCVEHHYSVWASELFRCLMQEWLSYINNMPPWLYFGLLQYSHNCFLEENVWKWHNISQFWQRQVKKEISTFSILDLIQNNGNTLTNFSEFWQIQVQSYGLVHFLIHSPQSHFFLKLQEYCQKLRQDFSYQECNTEILNPIATELKKACQEYWKK